MRKNVMYCFSAVVLLFFYTQYAYGNSKDVLFETNKTIYIYVDKNEKEVVHTAVSLLQKDVQTVFNAQLQLTKDIKKAQIVVTSLQQGEWETFSIFTQEKNRKKQLIISGSDARGKAYGILELSRMIGVSPWHYFADVKPKTNKLFHFPEQTIKQSPSVQYRGIFLNDEDWGLMPWATQTLAPNSPLLVTLEKPRGAIGPEAYEKIFELILRLRGNAIWPAMHECTVPFYFVKGNREMADKYGIVVGTSHCEPLARNSASEWDISGKGDYNFLTNRQNVLDYWTERLKELKDSENIFTIGMRGKHDGLMQGVRTLAEHKKALSEIIPTQQELLKKYINPTPEKIAQAFIPYKEVLDVYNDGLEVPDYVTLVWCDDNYGYIKRLSNEEEQKRSGGSGVYFHVSYWGRPHDYLWLASMSPALVYTEMKRAYEHGANRSWILNVGDIKPAEYLTEFFLDLAWDITLCDNASVFVHLHNWAKREFGELNASKITDIKKEYYRLANFRPPEFMGWSQVEVDGFPRRLTPVKDTDYNPDFNNELQRRVDNYISLEHQTAEIKQNIPAHQKSMFYQLVEYPVVGASLMNQKWLYAQMSRYHTNNDIELAKKYAKKSQNAYHKIEQITEEYNRMEDGKWNRMMDFNPRNLPVFAKPRFPEIDELPEDQADKSEKKSFIQPLVLAQNANQAINLFHNGEVVDGLGHSFAAVKMQQGDILSFDFELPESGEYWIKIATIPNHDVDGKGMKIVLSVDGKEIQEFNYRTVGRSETWKQNVLRGQAVSSVNHHFPKAGKVNISIKAITRYIILDQIMIGKGSDSFYEFPVSKQ